MSTTIDKAYIWPNGLQYVKNKVSICYNKLSAMKNEPSFETHLKTVLQKRTLVFEIEQKHC